LGYTVGKPIKMTMHATERALTYNLEPEDIVTIVTEGKRTPEGKTKCRYVLQTRREKLIAICDEDPDRIIVITVTKGGETD
jgi:hypothetical protein